MLAAVGASPVVQYALDRADQAADAGTQFDEWDDGCDWPTEVRLETV